MAEYVFVKWYLDFCEILCEFQSSTVHWIFSMQILERYKNFVKTFPSFYPTIFMYYEILRFLWNSIRVSLFIFPFCAVFKCFIQIGYTTWFSNLNWLHAEHFHLLILLFFIYYEILRFPWNSFRVPLFISTFCAVFKCLIEVGCPTRYSNIKLTPCRVQFSSFHFWSPSP